MKDDKSQAPMFVELREALHQHIEKFRSCLAEYSVAVERRIHNDIQAVTILSQENAIQELSPPSKVVPIASVPEQPGQAPTAKASNE